MGKRTTTIRYLGTGKKMAGYKTAKYRNKRVKHGDRTFDSKRERDRYIELTLLQGAGHISDLECQPRYGLTAGLKPVKYESGRQATYTADFKYIKDGELVVEDVKGFDTSESKLRRAILKAETGIKVVIVR